MKRTCNDPPSRPVGEPSPAWIGLPLLLLLGLFAYNVHLTRFLGDDAYISFRYAGHLAEGSGLVWNPGERVEGYSNFLWVVILAAAMRLGAAPEAIAVGLGIASGLGVLALLLIAEAREHGWRDPLVWVAPAALAASRSFSAWCTGGLETMFFTLLLVSAWLALLRERRRGATRPWVSALLLAMATLTRPEGALFAAVAAAFLLVEIARRRRPAAAGLVWLAPYVLIVGSHLLWRRSYYDAWLPNSFHAKVPGLWWEQGLRYLKLFATDYGIGWFLPLILAAVLLRRRPAVALAAASTLAYLVYVAAVGGDRFEFRFVVVVMPWVYWLIVQGMRGLIAAQERVRPVSLLLSLALLLLTGTAGRGPVHDGVRHGVAGLGTIRDYAARRAEEGRFLRRLIDSGKLPADLTICVGGGGGGALPYYTDWPTVDRRDINDRTIARLPLAERGTLAHERDAPVAYLRRRGVVVFDAFNRIVHDEDFTRGRRRFTHDGVELPLYVVRAEDRYLVFASLVPDDEVRRTFAAFEFVD